MAIVACFGGAYADTVGVGNPTFVSDSHVKRLLKLLPLGPAWTRVSSSYVYSLMRGLSHEFARVGRRVSDLNETERDPRLADEMLEDWERLAGMPRFGELATDKATRRTDVHREITFQPNLAPQGIIDAGTERDFNILEVDRRSHDSFKANSPCNDPCNNAEWRFVWSVRSVTPTGVRPTLEAWLDSITPQHTVREDFYFSPALQPTIESPLAQWALGDTTDYLATDRSGNSRDLSAEASAALTPDLRAGFVALFKGNQSTGVIPDRTDAALRLTGALTITGRLWVYATNTTTIVSCSGDETNETAAHNCLYSLDSVNSGGAQRLRYFSESGAGVDASFTTSTLSMDFGKWYFFALRRNSAGTIVKITLGDIDGNNHETSGTLTAPDDGSSSVFRIGGKNLTGSAFLGALSDVCIWGTELSDGTLETLRAAAMGG